MSRQHAAPILISADGNSQVLPSLGGASNPLSENDIQELVHSHPECLPISEIDPNFVGAIAVCRELNTSAGPIDNLLITPGGLPIIVECKLWRNPEGRREVVGQILDYAKELSRWSCSDLQREVNRRLETTGNPLLALLRSAGHEVDEIALNDAVTLNLRRGRVLLLIVGDGIREGVEAISSYLQAHLGLQFSFGLVELPVYALAGGARLVAPRVLARTVNITRHVIALPDGHVLQESETIEDEIDSDRAALSTEQQQFWAEFLSGVKLDDPEQPLPKPARLGYLTFMLPAPQGSAWVTVWRVLKNGTVGLTLSSTRGYIGEAAMKSIVEDWERVGEEIGGKAGLVDQKERKTIEEWRHFGDLQDPQVRARAFNWLRERLNVFINVLRPRVRSIVADLQERQQPE